MARKIREIDPTLALLQKQYAAVEAEKINARARIQALVRDELRLIRSQFAEKVAKVLNAGYYKADISRALGVSRPTLDGWLREWAAESPIALPDNNGELVSGVLVTEWAWPETRFKHEGGEGRFWYREGDQGYRVALTLDDMDNGKVAHDRKWDDFKEKMESIRPGVSVPEGGF